MTRPTLLLDTAMPRALVAVAVGGRVVFTTTLTTPQRHAEELPDAVARTLAAAGYTAGDVGGVLVGKGPGSFIGVRIALSFAQGFARARGVSAHGFSTLLALAGDPTVPRGRGLAIVDAKKGERYALLVRVDDVGLHADGEPLALSPSALVGVHDAVDFVVGTGLDDLPFGEGVRRVLVDGVSADGALAASRAHPETPPLPDYRRAPDVRAPAPR